MMIRNEMLSEMQTKVRTTSFSLYHHDLSLHAKRIPFSFLYQCSLCVYLVLQFCNFVPFPLKYCSKLLLLLSHFSLVLATPWTAAYQAPLSMRFSRQEYQSGVPLPQVKFGLPLFLYGPREKIFLYFKWLGKKDFMM